MGNDHSERGAAIRTVIEIGCDRDKLTRDMDAEQAHDWSNKLIDSGFVIEQSNAFRTVFFDQRTRLRAWTISAALYRPDIPVVT